MMANDMVTANRLLTMRMASPIMVSRQGMPATILDLIDPEGRSILRARRSVSNQTRRKRRSACR
jgi:hypothetical protein